MRTRQAEPDPVNNNNEDLYKRDIRQIICVVYLLQNIQMSLLFLEVMEVIDSAEEISQHKQQQYDNRTQKHLVVKGSRVCISVEQMQSDKE